MHTYIYTLCMCPCLGFLYTGICFSVPFYFMQFRTVWACAFNSAVCGRVHFFKAVCGYVPVHLIVWVHGSIPVIWV